MAGNQPEEREEGVPEPMDYAIGWGIIVITCLREPLFIFPVIVLTVAGLIFGPPLAYVVGYAGEFVRFLATSIFRAAETLTGGRRRRK